MNFTVWKWFWSDFNENKRQLPILEKKCIIFEFSIRLILFSQNFIIFSFIFDPSLPISAPILLIHWKTIDLATNFTHKFVPGISQPLNSNPLNSFESIHLSIMKMFRNPATVVDHQSRNTRTIKLTSSLYTQTHSSCTKLGNKSMESSIYLPLQRRRIVSRTNFHVFDRLQ